MLSPAGPIQSRRHTPTRAEVCRPEAQRVWPGAQFLMSLLALKRACAVRILPQTTSLHLLTLMSLLELKGLVRENSTADYILAPTYL